MPRLGSYNLHGSAFTEIDRGQTCVNWAVVNGEKCTGGYIAFNDRKSR